ncbi:RNA polymerase sigma factor ShbA [Nocardia flavorosea]|uniref:RNA polymerase sigma factor ShbA n=1 Tax=Nocardia flavorosea TaxID=53429 RepID=UPI001893B47D|nr:RNA polymerase sigma factor ShbA [Nocardia flavorosea]MBF6348727.1 RNA polymerase sigma factor ShbA [Nocardia flavorosea]
MLTEQHTITRPERGREHPVRAQSRLVSAELELLVEPAAGGDRRAVAEILRLVQPLIQRYCRTRLGNPAHLHVTADDVTQEVLMAVVAAIPRYRDQGKSFLAFVYGIAANKVSDAFRGAQAHPAYPVADIPELASPAAGPEERALAAERGAVARELIQQLNPVHRKVLVMRIVLGLSAAETAAELGTSAGVVRVMQYRALNKLRARAEWPVAA